MKHWMLSALLPHWPKGRLKEARRVATNALLLRFDRQSFLIDLSPSNALIVPDAAIEGDHFGAPFDVLLHKQLSGADLIAVRLDDRDKVLFLDFCKSGRYKAESVTLILELTGRHTNAILTNPENTILEALHHIKNRIRHIAPHQSYTPPPPPPRAPVAQSCEDIITFLQNQWHDRQQSLFERVRTDRLRGVEKRITHFEKLLGTLSDNDQLQTEADRARLEGSLILANLNRIKGYDKTVQLEDFEGQPITLHLPLLGSAQQMANARYKEARRLEAKAKGVDQERRSLQSRLDFYRHLAAAVNQAEDYAALEMLVPQKSSTKGSEQKRSEPIEIFHINGFRVLLGRNESGNAILLKRAKATDLWLHLQGRPSTHVIIQTNRQNIPPKVIERAAKLCAQFSLSQKGVYLVDYTPRRYVKIVQNAQVNYTHQKTVAITL